VNTHLRGEHRLAQVVEQERGTAVQAGAADGADDNGVGDFTPTVI
jgi:hypothetical protein